MSGAVWTRTTEDAYANPYDYEAQRLFLNEAAAILAASRDVLLQLNKSFTVEERSVAKATWMLQFDALDALADALFLFTQHRPSAAGRMFRDVLDTLDVAEHFMRGGQESRDDLAKWYEDEVVGHRRARESAGREGGEAVKNAMTEEYGDFSHFVHRTYRILQRSYQRGDGDRIWNETKFRELGRPLPHTVAEFLTIFAHLIVRFVNHLRGRKDVDLGAIAVAVGKVFSEASEAESA